MLSGIVAIACYISPNPSPLEWMVSGPKTDVERVEREVLTAPGAELVDRASGAHLDFARFRVPAAIRYGDFMGIMNAAWRPHVLMSAPAPLIPSCAPNGRAEDIDNPHAPVIVGVFGDAENVARFREQHPWAAFSNVSLADGRKGIGFEPSAAQASRYDDFVAAAAAGNFASVEIVLLSAPSTKSK